MMKKALLFLSLLSIACISVWAQETDYLPFIEEGKIWVSGTFPMGDSRQTPFQIITFSFEGDTLVNGQPCKLWVKRTRHLYNSDGHITTDFIVPIYEEGRRVWFFYPEEVEPRLLYDFNITESPVTLYRPGEPGTKDRQGRTFCHRGCEAHDSYRFYYFQVMEDEDVESDSAWDKELNCWVEGIGTWIAPDYNDTMDLVGNVETLLECSVNGHNLYKDPNWKGTDITAISKASDTNGATYDLSGRRVTEGHRGLKIQKGRKVF